MIRLVSRVFLQKEWTDLVSEFHDLSLEQTWEYGEVKAQTGPWKVERAIFMEGDRCVGAVQALVRPFPLLGGGYVRISRGPLWCRSESRDPSFVPKMMEELRRLWVEELHMYLRVEPSICNGEMDLKALESAGYRAAGGSEGWASARVDLSQPTDTLRGRLRSNWRNHLNKAERLGLWAEYGQNSALFRELLEHYERALRQQRYRTSVTPNLLFRLKELLGDDPRLWVFAGRCAGQQLGGLLVARYGSTCEYLVGAFNQAGRAVNAGHFLLWQAICKMREHGCRWFDLGGMDPVRTPPGIFHFKSGVGGLTYRLIGEVEAFRGGMVGRAIRWRVNRTRKSALRHLPVDRVRAPRDRYPRRAKDKATNDPERPLRLGGADGPILPARDQGEVGVRIPSENTKAWAKRSLAVAYRLGRRRRLFGFPASEFVVLTFHRVTTAEAFEVGLRHLVNADPETFARMLDFLIEHFQLVSVDQILAALEGQGHCSLPPDSLLLTFDDGYRDFNTTALPVLKSRNVPALIFPTTAGLTEPKRLLWIDKVALAVDTGLVDGWLPAGVAAERELEMRKNRIVSYLLDAPLKVLRRVEEELDQRLPILSSEVASRLYMSAQDLRTVGPAIAVGSHGMSHRVLSRLSGDEVVEELSQSKAVIEAATGRVVDIFAYPVGRAGDVPADADSLLPACGYSMGFTMESGRNVAGPGAPRYRFRRISAGRSISELQCNLLRASVRSRD